MSQGLLMLSLYNKEGSVIQYYRAFIFTRTLLSVYTIETLKPLNRYGVIKTPTFLNNINDNVAVLHKSI